MSVGGGGFWGAAQKIETYFNDLRIKYVVLTGYILKLDLT
jgi:hypothetical protein